MGKLFGTDGVRGVAGEFLTADLALALGRAAAATSQADSPQVLIVRDTRESGEMLEAALAAGVAAGGGQALLGGVLPTPGAVAVAARPSASASSAVRNSPATPRTPSVPNSLRSGGRAGVSGRAPIGVPASASRTAGACAPSSGRPSCAP